MATLRMMIWLVMAGAASQAADNPVWMDRLVFWTSRELRSLASELEAIEGELGRLPEIAGVNSGVRTGYRSARVTEGQDLWVEVELAQAVAIDTVVLVPMLARASSGEVPGFGFPKRFLLEGFDADGGSVLLMDETGRDFPNPGLYPVCAACPPGSVLRRIRLTVTEPWESGGPRVLALSEILLLNGNHNMTGGAKVEASSSREIPPTWSRHNLLDMQTPLGLPLAPGGTRRMGWHGPVVSNMNDRQAIIVDLGKVTGLDEIRLVPAWRGSMDWNVNYGFPSRFRVEISTTPGFEESVTVHDNTQITLDPPGQNLQVFHPGGAMGRYVRVTATRLRDRTGDFVFALGELQAYSHGINAAKGAAVIASNDSFEDEEWSPAGLTDGFSKGGVLLELPAWFRLLEQRRLLEGKRDHLSRRSSEVFANTQYFMIAASVGGAGAISLVAGLFAWRSHRQRLLDRERHRERLARDLHDELGSNLGSIALLSSLAKHEDGAQLQVDLAHIEKVARESAESMRDLVNLLGDRRADPTADWLSVMNRLAHGMMREVDLECRLPTARLIWEPAPETKREIYLFCKEVLHNALRHGKPTHVKFHLSPTRKGIRIEITDDGCGFTPSANGKGNGLRNLRDRAAIMRGEMTLNSSPDTGTRVVLAVPRGRRWNKCSIVKNKPKTHD